MAPKTALVILIENSEEMEAVICIDVLRRGGIDVTVAGVNGAEPVKCRAFTVIVPDKSLADVSNQSFDAVILPGGLKASDALATNPLVGQVLKAHASAGSIIATICAACLAVQANGLFIGHKMTSHPLVRDKVSSDTRYTYSENRVVHDGQLITSRAPGTAFEFALKLVQVIVGSEADGKVSKEMLLLK